VPAWLEGHFALCAVEALSLVLPKGNATGTEVAKATPYLEGKPKGDKSMAEERAERRSTY
jgi:hypothetical protein